MRWYYGLEVYWLVDLDNCKSFECSGFTRFESWLKHRIMIEECLPSSEPNCMIMK